MLDINSFTTSIKNQVLGWLSSIGTNLICPLIAAAAAIYCIFQLPQLFKAHREGTSEVFWDFLWKEIIGLVDVVGFLTGKGVKHVGRQLDFRVFDGAACRL